MQLLHCQLLSSCQFESTIPPAAQFPLSQTQQGDLVGHHKGKFEKFSRPSCEPLYARNNSRLKQETLIYKYFPTPSFHTKAQENADFRLYTPEARLPF
jgi:hypothetical protein